MLVSIGVNDIWQHCLLWLLNRTYFVMFCSLFLFLLFGCQKMIIFICLSFLDILERDKISRNCWIRHSDPSNTVGFWCSVSSVYFPHVSLLYYHFYSLSRKARQTCIRCYLEDVSFYRPKILVRTQWRFVVCSPCKLLHSIMLFLSTIVSSSVIQGSTLSFTCCVQEKPKLVDVWWLCDLEGESSYDYSWKVKEILS